VSPIFSISVKLTGKFTSLEEPTDDSDIATDVVFSADGPNFVGSERQVVPKIQCESWGFWSLNPSPDLSLWRPE
jgi:hypothetical protein